MQSERERRNDNIFKMGDDPFGNFRGFGSMMRPSSLFGSWDPFDDPFFTRPFQTSFFHSPTSASNNNDASPANKGVLIQELDSDDDDDDRLTQKQSASENQPSVEHPDDDDKSKNVNHRNDYNRTQGTKPQPRNISFQTCKVTCGGVDGAYYTSTRNRRAGNDGVVIEETKEADKTTGQATHRISRGIHDKGHSVTRKLASDGKVDTAQTLHNLNEDELAGFEEAWKGNVRGQLPGWSDQSDMHSTAGSSNSEKKGMATWAGFALPSGKQYQNPEATSAGKNKKVVRINIE